MPRQRLAFVLLCLCVLAGSLLLGARWVYDSARVEPDKGGTFVEAIAGRPQYVNPLLAQFNDADRDLVALVFAGLTKVGAGGRVEPDLAESWDISADGKTYTFKLRADRKFHDGQPVLADDVLFTIGLLQDPAFPGLPDVAAQWQDIAVKKQGDRTVVFTLPQPYGPFLEQATLGILSARQFAGVTAANLVAVPFQGLPVGAGPFKVSQLNVQQAVLQPDPNYPGPKSYLDSLVVKFYPTSRATLLAVQAGEASGARAVPAEEIPRLKQDRNLALLSVPLEGRAAVLFLNNRRAPFDTAAVRQAVALAIDRQVLIDQALSGQGKPAYGPISPLSWGYVAVGQGNQDLRKAETLLAEAGWVDTNGDGLRERDEEPLAVALASSDDPERRAAAAYLAAQLSRLGFRVELQPQSWEQLRDEHLATHDFDAALADVWLPNYDPDVLALWHSSQATSGLNLSGWSSGKGDGLLEQGRDSWQQSTRTEAYAAFQKTFGEDMPAVFLYYPTYTYALRTAVQGVSLQPLLDPSERFRGFAAWYTQTKKVIFQ
jgi:peptide/nickel transport system substrate-binding protein